MKEARNVILGCLLVFSLLLPVSAQSLQHSSIIPTVNNFFYGLQRYTGFNFFVDFVAEAFIRTYVKLKTKAKNVDVDLKIYSGWDLFKKKAQSLSLYAQELYIKGIPVETFKLTTNDPIYFKKNGKGKNRSVIPLGLKLVVNIVPHNIIYGLSGISQSKDKAAVKVKLPIPPFGGTDILLQDIKIKLFKGGLVSATVNAVSLINPDSEPLEMEFLGKMILRDKKLLISELKSEAKDIFTADSDVSKAFCIAVEDLVNPVINFHKFERGGITINNIDYAFFKDRLFLQIDIILMPEETYTS